ncbi:hypothetical protein SAY87_002417 [Trapa incisa]|uniref:Pectinesterase inhibitor domain-containing protein n=1 Tax=Trapa incisa TaxID=236973 RepID=A0AAN7JZP2_9MYRT|nr:hypothetical protein SAY87_002417 [Trapa incisa]
MEWHDMKKSLLLLGIIFSSASTVSSAETSLVRQVCGNTSSIPYNECVVALNGDFRTKKIRDIRALTFLSLDLAMANSSEAVGFVGGMAVKAPAGLKRVLKFCYDSLYSSNRNFHSAVGDLMVDPMVANYDVLIAMDGVRNCRYQMETANVSIPAVNQRCNNVELFVRICYTTTNLAKKFSGKAI